MSRKIFVSFLKSIIFLDIMEIISSDDNCPFHFHAFDDTCQDTTTYAYFTRKRTLLINIGSFNSLRNTNTQNDVILRVVPVSTIKKNIKID